jgi:UDP-N-acetylmuramate--alanine ligase
MPELAAMERIHVVGAGGAGMSALARLLTGMGYSVSGSDLHGGRALDALAPEVEVWTGHRPGRAREWDLVVRSTAVPASDPEVAAAAACGVPVWERPELLHALTSAEPAVGITGTHGKTTTTALTVAALRGAALDPTFVVGGELVDLGVSARRGAADLFVLEADEAFGTFLSLELRALAVTNVESDHLDFYGTLAELEAAFDTVARSVDGPVVIGVDDVGGRRLAAAVDAVTYGTTEDADWLIHEVRHGPLDVGFTLTGPSAELAVTVPRPGLHMARNAAGVLALLAALDVDLTGAAAGIAGFAGVRRRFEVLGTFSGVTIVDDYAHHPTELAATIDAVRHSADRVWAVFQPHRYTRTAELSAALGEALTGADRIVVSDVYSAGEPAIPGVSGELVATAARAAGGAVEYVAARDAIAPHLADRVETGDLVLVLGAGDVAAVPGQLIARLEGRS